jgi:predicted 2-oxoglutarate/Fe(II)-dependent dioxygenase YbiX
MELTQHTPAIWTIRHFLLPEACAELIAQSEAIGYKPAEVGFSTGAAMMRGIRNNSRLEYESAELANAYWVHLQSHCPPTLDNSAAVRLSEKFKFYRYEPGERFKRHIDGRVGLAGDESRITFMIYLNDNFDGGTTAFDEVTIYPETGTALCFIHETKHEGAEVTRGVKYVLRSDVMYRPQSKAG